MREAGAASVLLPVVRLKTASVSSYGPHWVRTVAVTLMLCARGWRGLCSAACGAVEDRWAAVLMELRLVREPLSFRCGGNCFYSFFSEIAAVMSSRSSVGRGEAVLLNIFER